MTTPGAGPFQAPTGPERSRPSRTVATRASVTGVGLFTAKPVTLTFIPAAAGDGVRFRRTDLPGRPEIAAVAANAVTDPGVLGMRLPRPLRNTVLAVGQAAVVTTEHVLSALVGVGITDCTIELDAAEAPIADGSAAPFAGALLAAGLVDLPAHAQPVALDREITVEGPGGARITARPSPAPRLTYHLDYGPGAPISPQSASWSPDDDYAALVAPARTFCLQEEAVALRAAGLFTHLSTRDMLVIGPAGPVENTLRFPDEPARHKLLDLIGDVALVGRPILADITASRSGHALNLALALALLREAEARAREGATARESSSAAVPPA